jgi:hypothetical protein
MPTLVGPADGHDHHVPVPRITRYDLTTGKVLNGPATKDLGVYEVNDTDGTINVRV